VLVIVAVTLVAVSLAGCSRAADPQLSAVVRAYADALVPALHAETLDPLRKVAVPDEVERVRLYVLSYLDGKNQRIVARLRDQTVTATKQTGKDTAEVTATEQWVVTYVDRTSGKELERVQRTDHVTYHLKRIKDVWYVEGATVK
jgi:hypothetical protein